MEGISPEQLREAINGYTAKGEPERSPDLSILIAAARELLALKEAAPSHQDYDVALPDIEEWVNKHGAW